MASDFPDDDLLAAYREKTSSGPAFDLAKAIRGRLTRPRILPQVAAVCLAASMALAGLVSFVVSSGVSSRQAETAPPPPLFEERADRLFAGTSPPALP